MLRRTTGIGRSDFISLSGLSGFDFGKELYRSNAERLHEATVTAGCDAITKLLPPPTQLDREEETSPSHSPQALAWGTPPSRIIGNHLNGFRVERNEKPQAKAWGE